jgi:septum formation protein
MLILASASPRRHELLQAARIDHVVRASHIDEIRSPGESPQDYVQRIAREKAAAVPASSSDIVLGADTVVCLEEEVLGKPGSTAEAIRMLRALSGRRHIVLTGISLRRGDSSTTDVAETAVWFNQIEHSEMLEYVATGEPMDKAGAYAIQGYASRFVRRIEGCYHNVVGLPVSLVYRHLKLLCGS